MPPNLLKYSNGWGHLLMSLALLATGIILILMRDPSTNAVGIGLISTVAGYWFISSSANAQQAAQQGTTQIQVPPAPITIASAPAPAPPAPITGGQTNGSS